MQKINNNSSTAGLIGIVSVLIACLIVYFIPSKHKMVTNQPDQGQLYMLSRSQKIAPAFHKQYLVIFPNQHKYGLTTDEQSAKKAASNYQYLISSKEHGFLHAKPNKPLVGNSYINISEFGIAKKHNHGFELCPMQIVIGAKKSGNNKMVYHDQLNAKRADLIEHPKVKAYLTKKLIIKHNHFELTPAKAETAPANINYNHGSIKRLK